jgi:hypothetical protein
MAQESIPVVQELHSKAPQCGLRCIFMWLAGPPLPKNFRFKDFFFFMYSFPQLWLMTLCVTVYSYLSPTAQQISIFLLLHLRCNLSLKKTWTLSL